MSLMLSCFVGLNVLTVRQDFGVMVFLTSPVTYRVIAGRRGNSPLSQIRYKRYFHSPLWNVWASADLRCTRQTGHRWHES